MRVHVAISLLAAVFVAFLSATVEAQTQEPDPTLVVGSDRVVRGSEVTVSGTGYRCVSAIDLALDDVVLATVSDTEQFVTSVTIPVRTAPGMRTFTSTCDVQNLDDVIPVSFDVLQASAQVMVLAPRLGLVPERGGPGDRVEVRVLDHPCRSVIVDWGAVEVTTVERTGPAGLAGDGGFDVPEDAAPGTHEVASRCPGGAALATLPFEVVAGPTTSDGSGSTTEAPTTSARTTTQPTTTEVPQQPSTTLPAEGPGTDRAEFAASVLTVDELQPRWESLLASFVIALVIVLLIGFPAAVFNSTLEDHYDEIYSPFRRLPLPKRANAGLGVPLAAFAVAALLSTLVTPDLAVTRQTLALTLGLFVAFVVITLAFELPQAWVLHRSVGEALVFRAYPGALALAFACAVLSRAADFRPGYVYGLIAGFAVSEGRRVADRDAGRAAALGAAVVLVVSASTLAAWSPLDRYADDHRLSFPLLVAHAAMAGVFVAGFEGVTFQLLPLRFLDGARVRGWSRAAWGSLFGVAMFGLSYAIFRGHPDGREEVDESALVPMLVLFAAFAAFSFTFWGYFLVRARVAAHPPLRG